MSMPSVLCGKEGERGQCVIVALDGDKASTDKTGVAPLSKALRELVGPSDELLVLAIINIELAGSLSSSGNCSFGGKGRNRPCEGAPYIRFLLEEISRRKENYKHIFRPFYDKCKSNEVKFQVRVSAGCQPREIIMEEAYNSKANWIVIDRCFAKDMSPRSVDTDCSLSLMGEDEEAMILKYLALNDESENSAVDQLVTGLKSSDLTEELSRQEEPDSEAEFQPLPPLILESMEGENPKLFEPYEECENVEILESPIRDTLSHDESILSQRLWEVMQGRPLQLSQEIIAAITGGFLTKISINRLENSETYVGFVANRHVMVKRFKGDAGDILEAEKKVALKMYHKNILGLRGYHSCENTTVLVFPLARGGTLDKYLHGSRGKAVGLTFDDKMKIAVGIAKGIRYMHEACPRGPVAHRDLKPHNITLTHDLRPQISGFGRATWLHLEQSLQFTDKRSSHKDPSENRSMVLIKSDVFSFGVLLLRLFCQRSMPEDDKILIKWARPLLLERAFHELLGEDTSDLDMYGLYKVMAAATHCTKTKPPSRPSMSEVISILTGQSSCAMQCSPSTESSNM